MLDLSETYTCHVVFWEAEFGFFCGLQHCDPQWIAGSVYGAPEMDSNQAAGRVFLKVCKVTWWGNMYPSNVQIFATTIFWERFVDLDGKAEVFDEHSIIFLLKNIFMW